MTNSELRSKHGIAVQDTRWIRSICFTSLAAFQLLAAEHSATDNAWRILEAGLHESKADKRALAVAALGLMPGDRKNTPFRILMAMSAGLQLLRWET